MKTQQLSIRRIGDFAAEIATEMLRRRLPDPHRKVGEAELPPAVYTFVYCNDLGFQRTYVDNNKDSLKM